MRGVHQREKRFCSFPKGSSPHARGPPAFPIFVPAAFGIIPACAGSTDSQQRTKSGRRDHPRMRGVHWEMNLISNIYVGSSPHARGPHPGRHFRERTGRIIPACAGSTIIFMIKRFHTWDHPRMRGVHNHLYDKKVSHLGSSPHARGPPTATGIVLLLRRIIPACAGSTVKPVFTGIAF